MELAWNPEFLREGHAVADTLRPERIVAGVRSAAAEAILREVYAEPLAAGVPFVVTDFATAELVKVAANAFLATKISFINAMAEVCEAAGADVTSLAQALAYDHRIGGAGMRPGLGFGGGCLPKDIRAFRTRAEELGAGEAVSFLASVDTINTRRRTRMVELARELAGGTLAGRTVGVLGLAFKPDSDDIRDSPALDVAMALHRGGARVVAYDPAAVERARAGAPGAGVRRLGPRRRGRRGRAAGADRVARVHPGRPGADRQGRGPAQRGRRARRARPGRLARGGLDVPGAGAARTARRRAADVMTGGARLFRSSGGPAMANRADQNRRRVPSSVPRIDS